VCLPKSAVLCLGAKKWFLLILKANSWPSDTNDDVLPTRSLEQNPENLLCFPTFAVVWLKTTHWPQQVLGRKYAAEWHVGTHILLTSTKYSQNSIHIRWMNGEYINVENHLSLLIREVIISDNEDRPSLSSSGKWLSLTRTGDSPWNDSLLKSNHLLQLLAHEYFTEFSYCEGFNIHITHFSDTFKMLPGGCFYTAKWEKMSSTWQQYIWSYQILTEKFCGLQSYFLVHGQWQLKDGKNSNWKRKFWKRCAIKPH